VLSSFKTSGAGLSKFSPHATVTLFSLVFEMNNLVGFLLLGQISWNLVSLQAPKE
jgi:hypothetical protein